MKNLMVTTTETIKEVEDYANSCKLLVAIKSNGEWFFYAATNTLEEATALINERQRLGGRVEMKAFPNPNSLLSENFFAVVDCEWTVNGLIYDIGVSIMDKVGTVVFCRGWLINETVSNGGAEMEEILKGHAAYSGGQYRRAAFREAMEEISELMTEYGCQSPYAFNGWADIRAIIRTAEQYEVKTPFWMMTTQKEGYVWTKYGVYDILPEAKLLLQQKYAELYRRWCQEFGFLTPNCKPSFSAEAIYSFLVRKANYREDHSGLDDSRDECLILHWLKCHDISFSLRETKKKIK